MPESRITSPLPVHESMTITIENDEQIGPSACWSVPTSHVCSYTLPDDGPRPSAPLNEGTVRIGNSILRAFVPEDAALRGTTEDF
jgi:hypothetical protein